MLQMTKTNILLEVIAEMEASETNLVKSFQPPIEEH